MTMAPPPTPTELDDSHIEAEHTSWPTVMGVLLLIWAVVTSSVMCCGTGWLFIGPRLAAAATESVQRAAPTAVIVATVLGCVCSVVLGVVLAMGAFALLKRRTRARTYLMWYAFGRYAVAPILLIVSIMAEKPQWEFQRQAFADQVAELERANGPASVPPFLRDLATTTEAPAYVRAMTLGMIAFGLVVPTIVGIVMIRRPVRDEMARWQP